ncbi:aminoglycoside phosphotransferase family protein [Pedobacter sp. KR3-3]|uniref:Aminoglycoside phosphotransferase family protein n=1 Tax=Pedobacter albus TaxID=3113905 RepID=A0ABU7I8A6_9SPHI|nr:aminoglycoside phosphotransferase family protein [Pedobacter sp. KR3-3]MEE1945707.1 aminoglycoside phosphotransferase family protein [Pedobacter sp. KR3-3]
MELILDEAILKAYGFSKNTVTLQQIGSGLINRTYLLLAPNQQKYILQNINAQVFHNPLAIAHNISAIADYLKANDPDYLFPAPIATLNGSLMATHNGEYWRLLPFVSDSVAFDTLNEPKQAYEAAKQFGKLSLLLNGFDTTRLSPTIPGFHNLALRYEQFTFTLGQCSEPSKKEAEQAIAMALQYHFILAYYHSYEHRHDFPDRVIHHDTKISNVLLNETSHEGVCVIDLDTLMPGKFISDLGDMLRSYTCAFSENETNLELIKIRLPYFKATIQGYLSTMGAILTSTEKELILFSGKYMVYMQALRFLTDYLNGSIYYPIAYPSQNLDRAKNQFKLLKEFFANEKVLQDIIEDCLP